MKPPTLSQINLFGSVELEQSKVCKSCKQRLTIKKFYEQKQQGKIYYSSRCINCNLKHQHIYKHENKEILRRKRNEKVSTEEGAINQIYLNIKSRLKAKRKRLDISDVDIIKYYSCKVTKEKLFEIWKKQYEKYGMHCPISKQKMTFLRRQTGKQGAGYSNTVSIDRLDPNRCYEENNIIFIAYEVNTRKNKVTYEDCKRIIELHEERFKK